MKTVNYKCEIARYIQNIHQPIFSNLGKNTSRLPKSCKKGQVLSLKHINSLIEDLFCKFCIYLFKEKIKEEMKSVEIALEKARAKLTSIESECLNQIANVRFLIDGLIFLRDECLVKMEKYLENYFPAIDMSEYHSIVNEVLDFIRKPKSSKLAKYCGVGKEKQD